ncbi:hypothetical protein EI94DRAFT_959137 [Lactarius quietus]|nr:hypothetical protein EI94DRAFT_959137 [Lactarius quietus]
MLPRHYDVISVPPLGWESDPFELTARNDYLYARGVADDKEPVLAIPCAAADLLRAHKLGVDSFLVEGKEETGSDGLVNTVLKHKDLIGEVDAVITVLAVTRVGYPVMFRQLRTGLRGVVQCNIEISSHITKDSHSALMGRMARTYARYVQVLAELTDRDRKAFIPWFYDQVRPQDDEEAALFRLQESATQQSAASLSARWQSTACADPGSRVSLLDAVCASFDALCSAKSIKVTVEHTADWWLGDLTHPWFLELERAIRDERGSEPMRFIPCVPFLEKAFGCPALHLPMGQRILDKRICQMSISRYRIYDAAGHRTIFTCSRGKRRRAARMASSARVGAEFRDQAWVIDQGSLCLPEVNYIHFCFLLPSSGTSNID